MDRIWAECKCFAWLVESRIMSTSFWQTYLWSSSHLFTSQKCRRSGQGPDGTTEVLMSCTISLVSTAPFAKSAVAMVGTSVEPLLWSHSHAALFGQVLRREEPALWCTMISMMCWTQFADMSTWYWMRKAYPEKQRPWSEAKNAMDHLSGFNVAGRSDLQSSGLVVPAEVQHL